MNELENLKLKRRDIDAEIYAIERGERNKELSDACGKYFKYQNSFSCPDSQEDYWFMFRTYYKRGKNYFSFNFQTDKYGRLEVEERAELAVAPGWARISRAEFVREYKKAMRKIEKLFGGANS